LNLINNAFYAVHQRNQVETLHATSLQQPKYQPRVTLSTHHADSQIIIKVQDNGSGIPENIKAKIFQPFFTTKPKDQGTGLGLSIVDRLIQQNGGKVLADSKLNEGTVFKILLPRIKTFPQN
jgi:signal transduction histidine kinase